jgi:hypothetical protein
MKLKLRNAILKTRIPGGQGTIAIAADYEIISLVSAA